MQNRKAWVKARHLAEPEDRWGSINTETPVKRTPDRNNVPDQTKIGAEIALSAIK
ncbi:MAG: hypothetical protein FWG09_01170 [Synergistaceae bacterium]|nr:hypothetical protein [Synergistaceae bacterium]